jgi:hypothetical protein
MLNHVFLMRKQWKSSLLFEHIRFRFLWRTSSIVLPSDELHAHRDENSFGEIDEVRIFSFGEHSLNPP